jgi:hypothetical protein
MAGGDAFDEFNAYSALQGWSSRIEPGLSFQSPELREALVVWRAAAAGRPLPLRADVTPRAMIQFLPIVAIVDVIHEGDRVRFRRRVTGTELAHTFGIDSPGTFLDETMTEPTLTRWEKTLNAVLRHKGPVRFSGIVEFGKKSYLQVESLLAPLGADPGAPEAILLVVKVEPTKAPAA